MVTPRPQPERQHAKKSLFRIYLSSPLLDLGAAVRSRKVEGRGEFFWRGYKRFPKELFDPTVHRSETTNETKDEF